MQSQPSSAVTATAEALERRMLLTSSVWFDGETLFVRGDAQNQALEIIERKDAWPSLQLSFDADGDGLYTGAEDVQLGYANVKAYDIRLDEGDDSVTLLFDDGRTPINRIYAALGRGNDSFLMRSAYEWFGGGPAANIREDFVLTVVGGAGDDSVEAGFGCVGAVAKLTFALGDGNDTAGIRLRETVGGELDADVALGAGDDSFGFTMVTQPADAARISIDAHGGDGRDTLTGSAHRQDEEPRYMGATIRLNLLGDAGDDHVSMGFPRTPTSRYGWTARDTTIVTDESAPRQRMYVSGNVQYRNEWDPDETWEHRDWDMPGVTVYIDSDNDGELDDSEQRDVTDQYGSYNLGSHPIGECTVRVAVPDGWTLHAASEPFIREELRFQSFTLQTTGIRGNILAWPNPGSVAGTFVFLDLNRNGKADDSDPSVATDETGYYEFLGLAPGSYSIICIAPAGWVISGTLDRGATCLVTLAQGDLRESYRYREETHLFRIQPPPTIRGRAMPGTWLFVDDNKNGRLDLGERFTRTDAAGAYNFGPMPLGEYSVNVIVPDGFQMIGAEQPAKTIALYAWGDAFVDFSLSRFGINGTVQGATNQKYRYAPIPGVRVYLDLNSNGSLDSSEPVRRTDPDGRYCFANPPAGNYQVAVFGLNQKWNTAAPSQVAVTAGEVRSPIDFYLDRSEVLTQGTVFQDSNRTGWRDDRVRSARRPDLAFNGPTEYGIPGVTVYLDANANGALDPGEVTSLTDSHGQYEFSGADATTTVRVQVPDGWELFAAGDGDFALSSTGAAFPPVAAVLAGTVYVDQNHNGIFNWGSDSRAAGILVYLDSNGNLSFDEGEQSALSDLAGNYSFGDLPPGYYDLRVETLEGWLLLTNTRQVYLGAGETIENLSFGIQPYPVSSAGTASAILGTIGDDDILVSAASLSGVGGAELQGVQLTVNGVPGEPFLPAGGLVLYSRAGNDTVRVDPNVIIPVIVHGGLGDDTIVGGRGNDLLLGESDDDVIRGGNGNDRIHGGAGNDSLSGEEGADSIHGGHGNDVIYGRSGDDTLIGDNGFDLLYGGPDNDHIEGGGKADTLHGGSGNDTLISGAGADLLFGEDGDDELCANQHARFRDQLRGGAGQDKYEADEDDLLSDVEELLG